MNTVFVAIDGDDIGQKVGQSVLHDDPTSLAEISQKLSSGLESIKQWTESNQGHVVSLGGDEGVLMFEGVEDEDTFLDEVENLRQIYLQATGATITVGTGSSLSEAGKALLAGKLSGKDMIVPYGEEIEDILHDAHQHVLEGEGSEEEQKQDEHYISHLDGMDDDGQDVNQDYADEDSIDATPHLSDENSEEIGEYRPDLNETHGDDFILHHDNQTDEMPQEDEDYSDEDQDMSQFSDVGEQDADYEEDQPQENMESDEGDFDYNPDDYKYQSDQLPEEEAEASPEDQTTEGMDGGAEEMAGTAPHAEDESDEFSTAEDDMQHRVDDVIGSPDQQEEGEESEGEEEEPIEIPENENMESADEMESQELPMESDAGEEDPSAEMDAFNQMMSESGQDVAKMKQQVAEALSAFKEQKDQLVAIQDQVPELYQATLGMLQTMLDLSKALFGGGEENEPQEEASPDIEEGVPAEQEMEQEPSPKF